MARRWWGRGGPSPRVAPSPYLRLGRGRVQAGIVLVVAGGRHHRGSGPRQPPAARVQSRAVRTGPGQHRHPRDTGPSLQRPLHHLQRCEGQDTTAGGSGRDPAPLRAGGSLTGQGPADGALALAVQHAEAVDGGSCGHAGVAPAQHPGHVCPVAVALAGLARASRFHAQPIASKPVCNPTASSPSLPTLIPSILAHTPEHRPLPHSAMSPNRPL